MITIKTSIFCYKFKKISINCKNSFKELNKLIFEELVFKVFNCNINLDKSYFSPNSAFGSTRLMDRRAVGAVNKHATLWSLTTRKNVVASGVPTGLPWQHLYHGNSKSMKKSELLMTKAFLNKICFKFLLLVFNIKKKNFFNI